MILVDTGAWLALADRGDAYHSRCQEFFRRNREPLMTTYPVLVECVHLMFNRIGVAKTLAWMETFEQPPLMPLVNWFAVALADSDCGLFILCIKGVRPQ